MIILYLKKYISKGLKAAHNFFLKFGINISFVRKEDTISAIQHNSIGNSDSLYASKEHLFKLTSREHQKFFSKVQDLINQNHIDLNDKVVADVGCGIGNLADLIEKHTPSAKILGFDYSQVAVDYANSRGLSAVFSQHDIYDEFDQQFDFIFCTEVLEHLLYPEVALKHLFDAVSPGGGLLITVPDGRKDTWSGHINFWSPESWCIFIQSKSSGFTVKTGHITGQNLYALISDGRNIK